MKPLDDLLALARLGVRHFQQLWRLTLLRWYGFRLRRRLGFDPNEAMSRAATARAKARDRALLIDPEDRAAALAAGERAFHEVFSQALDNAVQSRKERK